MKTSIKTSLKILSLIILIPGLFSCRKSESQREQPGTFEIGSQKSTIQSTTYTYSPYDGYTLFLSAEKTDFKTDEWKSKKMIGIVLPSSFFERAGAKDVEPGVQEPDFYMVYYNNGEYEHMLDVPFDKFTESKVTLKKSGEVLSDLRFFGKTKDGLVLRIEYPGTIGRQ